MFKCKLLFCNSYYVVVNNITITVKNCWFDISYLKQFFYLEFIYFFFFWSQVFSKIIFFLFFINLWMLLQILVAQLLDMAVFLKTHNVLGNATLHVHWIFKKKLDTLFMLDNICDHNVINLIQSYKHIDANCLTTYDIRNQPYKAVFNRFTNILFNSTFCKIKSQKQKW